MCKVWGKWGERGRDKEGKDKKLKRGSIEERRLVENEKAWKRSKGNYWGGGGFKRKVDE